MLAKDTGWCYTTTILRSNHQIYCGEFRTSFRFFLYCWRWICKTDFRLRKHGFWGISVGAIIPKSISDLFFFLRGLILMSKLFYLDVYNTQWVECTVISRSWQIRLFNLETFWTVDVRVVILDDKLYHFVWCRIYGLISNSWWWIALICLVWSKIYGMIRKRHISNINVNIKNRNYKYSVC